MLPIIKVVWHFPLWDSIFSHLQICQFLKACIEISLTWCLPFAEYSVIIVSKEKTAFSQSDSAVSEKEDWENTLLVLLNLSDLFF